MEQINFLCTCGGGPGILAFVEALNASTTYDARVILADANPASGNLYLPGVDARYRIPACTEEDFIPALLRLIEKENVQYLYSGLDEELPVLARHRDLIESKNCRLLLPDAEALEHALDKNKMHDILQGSINLPRTFLIGDETDAESLYDRLEGRVLIKHTSSRGGRNIYFPEDREEYRFYLQFVEKMRHKGLGEFVVQELIEGDEYNVTTLHDLQSNLIYAVSRRKFETRKIKSTTTAAVIEHAPPVVEEALRSLEGMNLQTGFNNVELIVSRHDGKPYLIEINGGRTAAQDMNIVAAGINITDLMIAILRGERVQPIPAVEDGIATLKIRKDVIVRYDQIQSVPRA